MVVKRACAQLPDSSRLRHMISPQKTAHQAQLLANRLHKQFRHFSRRFRKQNIECFRIYDWDIPEIRAVVDWYAGHAVIAEYERWQTGQEWLGHMAAATAEVLNIPASHVHVKRRRTQSAEGAPRYSQRGSLAGRLEVRERHLRFLVNLDDYLDTGLFSDHRDTRAMVGRIAAGKNFLNLFAYTGAFTCAAAAGDAVSSVTVDRSASYLKWAADNLKLNGLAGPRHIFIQSDIKAYLLRARREGRRFTFAFVDPPSFSRDNKDQSLFDVNRDHPHLIRDVLAVMAPGSMVLFSTNHQRFEPRFEEVGLKQVKELTPETIPEDYRGRHGHQSDVHRCWQITVP